MKRVSIAAFLSAIYLLANIPLLAQKGAPTATATAPVPAQIVTAKKIFVGYEGGESQIAGYKGGPDRAYNQFYSALKNWGHYELVSTPAEAELVFELSFSYPLVAPSVVGGGQIVPGSSINDRHFRLTILDVKTHTVLWTLIEHVDYARLQGNRDKNFDQALVALLNDVSRLAGLPPAIALPPKSDKNDQESN
jgi:hypothetical protein